MPPLLALWPFRVRAGKPQLPGHAEGSAQPAPAKPLLLSPDPGNRSQGLGQDEAEALPLC